MKLIVSIAIGIAVWYGSVFLVWKMSHNTLMAWIIGILLGVSAIIVSFKKFGGVSVKETIADGVSYVKTTSEKISSLVDDKDLELYAIAEQEIKDDVINNGLWSQALVKAKGDENLRKVEYIKLRVKQLKK
jgi:hypothetical protein